MKKMMLAICVMLLGIALMLMADMMVVPIIGFWISVALLFVGFIMAVDGYINGDKTDNKDDGQKEQTNRESD